MLDCVQGVGETGAALVDEVDFIQFTGSDRTGRKVMERAAETLTPVSLELGGKDPMIVLDDADIERAANAAAWGGLMNSGQICMSVERIYVEEPVYDEFVAKLTDRGQRRCARAPTAAELRSDVGAMTSPDQIGDRRRPRRRRPRRRRPGADRRQAASTGPGDYFEPTVLVDVDHSMKVMRDETFGPVVGVMKVARRRGGVRLANDTRYGLVGLGLRPRRSGPSRSPAGSSAARSTSTTCSSTSSRSDVPMGGWKESGIGFRHGEYGIRKYCRPSRSSAPASRPRRSRSGTPTPEPPQDGQLVLTRFTTARGLKRFGR